MHSITQWIDRHTDSPTLLISTADHECGGLTVGDNYMWLPFALTQAKSSAERTAILWKSYTGPTPDEFLLSLFAKYGVPHPTPKQLAAAKAAKEDPLVSNFVFAKALAALLNVNFATIGHTAADVSLYAYGHGCGSFAGNHDNTEVAAFVTRTLNLDLRNITVRLGKEKKWINEKVKAPKGGKVRRRNDHLAHHHH